MVSDNPGTHQGYREIHVHIYIYIYMCMCMCLNIYIFGLTAGFGFGDTGSAGDSKKAAVGGELFSPKSQQTKQP